MIEHSFPHYMDSFKVSDTWIHWIIDAQLDPKDRSERFMGKDIIVQHGFTANLAGIDWLRRHFPDLRIHGMNFPGDPYPIHIDCTFVPLRPGLLLNNPIRNVRPEHRRLFELNGCEDYFPKQVEGF